MKPFRAILLTVMVATCAACGSHDRLIKKQEELDARIDQVIGIQSRINESLNELVRQVAELEVRLKGAMLEVEQLKPRYSELRTTLESTSERLEKLTTDTERRFSQGTQGTPPTSSSSTGAPPTASSDRQQELSGETASVEATHPPASPVGSFVAQPAPDDEKLTPTLLYTKAFRLYASDRHEEAITLFDRFLSLYPSHQYAPNALYWKGECHYALKKYELAYDIFKKVPQLYPTAGKVPDALFKSALSLAALGKRDEERRLLRTLIERYSRSEAARKAKERLLKESQSTR